MYAGRQRREEEGILRKCCSHPANTQTIQKETCLDEFQDVLRRIVLKYYNNGKFPTIKSNACF
jgi:hypothetical protein